MNPSSVDLGYPDLEEAFRSHRGLLFGLSYRLTGSVEDAQEIVPFFPWPVMVKSPATPTRPAPAASSATLR